MEGLDTGQIQLLTPTTPVDNVLPAGATSTTIPVVR
jgi:hypothetical protein